MASKRQLSVSTSSSSSSAVSSSSASEAGSDDEDEESLCEVGLHPMARGHLIGGSHRIEGVLGRGHFSTVFLCTIGNRQEAVKFYRAASRFREFAQDETKMLETVNRCAESHAPCVGDSLCVAKLLQSFLHEGPHCCHPCLVLELMGPTVLDLARQCRDDQLPLHVLRDCLRDSLCGLDFLHRACKIIHTDVKPENILTYLSEPSGFSPKRSRSSEYVPAISCTQRRQAGAKKLLRSATSVGMPTAIKFALADLGNACFEHAHASDFIQTCEYKAPEVLLGAGYDHKTDLWSLACTAFECATGRYLLDPRRSHARPQKLVSALRDGQASDAKCMRGSEDVPLEEEHIAQIVELVGTLPQNLLERGKLTRQLLECTECSIWTLRHTGIALAQLANCCLMERLNEHLGNVAPADVNHLKDVLSPMLALESTDRPDAMQLLQNSSWLCR